MVVLLVDEAVRLVAVLVRAEVDGAPDLLVGAAPLPLCMWPAQLSVVVASGAVERKCS